MKHFSSLIIPDAYIADSNSIEYAGLRRYAAYLIDFCEDVTVADADHSIQDLFEPICKMLEILSADPCEPAAMPFAQRSAIHADADVSSLLELVMKYVSFMDEAQGLYSFAFNPVSDVVAAKVYSSRSGVFAFAAASCYLQYKLDNAFPNSPPA